MSRQRHSFCSISFVSFWDCFVCYGRVGFVCEYFDFQVMML